MGDTDKAWEWWGKADPYYGVFPDEKYRRALLSKETLQEFFSSGEDHIDHVLSVINRHVAPSFTPTTALDFGCGVGRLVVPLASRCKNVTGVDVSQSMLTEAEKNCREAGLSNVRFIPSDDGLSRLTGQFDLIHSFIVFQHIPIRRGEKILEKLLAHLSVGGAIALHFTYDRHASVLRKCVNRIRHNVPLAYPLLNMLQGRKLSDRPQQMNCYHVGRLLNIFHAGGVDKLFIETVNYNENCGVVFYGLKSSI